MTIEIRPAIPGDAPACAAILQGWLDATPWMPNLHTLAGTEVFCRHDLIERQHTVVAGEPVAGFLSVSPETATVTALYVAEGRRSRGMGARLLDHAKGKAEVLVLWTFVANEGARRFYEREGFRESRRTDGDNDEGLPDILYRWSRDGSRG